jgi:DNA modification methylase
VLSPVVVRRPLGDDVPEALLYYGAGCLESLRTLETETIHCVVTSPPYWGLRDYESEPAVWGGDQGCPHNWEPTVLTRKGSTHGSSTSTLQAPGPKTYIAGAAHDEEAPKNHRLDESATCSMCGAWQGQLGLEPTPEQYIRNVVEVFVEVRRVLRSDGSLWLNLGDSFAQAQGQSEEPGTKPKDLVGIPWRVALALRESGWYLRSDIVWKKDNPMPESVRDRPTRAHEYIFLLTKSARYFYDADAIREPWADERQGAALGYHDETPERLSIGGKRRPQKAPKTNGRNKRSVWTINPKPYPGAHFATFPPELPRLCILAGTSERGCCPMCATPWAREEGEMVFEASCGCPAHAPVPCTVLDPFSGSGTTGQVSLDLGRAYVGLDVQISYTDLAVARLLSESAPSASGEPQGAGIFEFLGVEDP